MLVSSPLTPTVTAQVRVARPLFSQRTNNRMRKQPKKIAAQIYRSSGAWGRWRNADRGRLYFFLTCLRLYNVLPACFSSPRFFRRHIWALPSLSVTGVIRSEESMKCCRLNFPSFQQPWKQLRLMQMFLQCPQKSGNNKQDSVWRDYWLLGGKCWCIFAGTHCWIECRGTCDSLWNMREVKTEDIPSIPRILIFHWTGRATATETR